MKFIILSHMRNCDGLIDVDVLIDQKRYSFTIASEYDLNEAQKLIFRKRPGAALNLLKQRNFFLRKEKYAEKRKELLD